MAGIKAELYYASDLVVLAERQIETLTNGEILHKNDILTIETFFVKRADGVNYENGEVLDEEPDFYLDHLFVEDYEIAVLITSQIGRRYFVDSTMVAKMLSKDMNKQIEEVRIIQDNEDPKMWLICCVTDFPQI